MDANLNYIVEQFETRQFTAKAAAANAPIHQEESVAVTLYVTEGYAQDVWDWLEDSGADPRNIGVDYIEAYVPVSLLPQASQQEGVITIRTIVPPQTTQGPLVSEGVAVHGVAAWHEAGFRGQGVKIGIIDAGFEGFRSLMGTELPASVQARCYTDIGVFTSNLEDCYVAEVPDDHHGTASTEVVFDIAPDATFYIASRTRGFADLQDTVNWMVAQGVDVINTSLDFGWTYSSGDGTYTLSDDPLRSVDLAVSGGIVWVTSAGNGGNSKNSWFGDFSDADSDGWLEFSGTDETNQFHRTAGEGIFANLRWADNWEWGRATRDLELCLLTNGGEVIECNGGNATVPLVDIIYEVSHEGFYSFAVRHRRGSVPEWVELWVAGIELEYNTGGNYTIGNPAISRNPGLLAVGASPWVNPHIIAAYSSRGPTTDGRIKPDIIGATNTSSSVYEYGFGGTSAASPHVAGIAALVKQRFPHFSPQQITQYLKDNAEPHPILDPVLGPAAHPNNTWGHGFASAERSTGTRPLPLVMAADNLVQQSLVRLINRSDHFGMLHIHAMDDSGQRFGPLSVEMSEKFTLQFNSRDLEEGNVDKRLVRGVGDGEGNWRLAFGTALEVETFAYVRTADGLVTSMHEVAAQIREGRTRYHVPFFNPGSNANQVSLLRLINTGDESATVVIEALDDRGEAAPEGEIRLTLPAGVARMYKAVELERGAEGLTGRLGDGVGKWQLFVAANQPLQVMSLLQSPTGHLSNLSR